VKEDTLKKNLHQDVTMKYSVFFSSFTFDEKTHPHPHSRKSNATESKEEKK
jgi:hypothetical protein